MKTVEKEVAYYNFADFEKVNKSTPELEHWARPIPNYGFEKEYFLNHNEVVKRIALYSHEERGYALPKTTHLYTEKNVKEVMAKMPTRLGKLPSDPLPLVLKYSNDHIKELNKSGHNSIKSDVEAHIVKLEARRMVSSDIGLRSKGVQNLQGDERFTELREWDPKRYAELVNIAGDIHKNIMQEHRQHQAIGSLAAHNISKDYGFNEAMISPAAREKADANVLKHNPDFVPNKGLSHTTHDRVFRIKEAENLSNPHEASAVAGGRMEMVRKEGRGYNFGTHNVYCVPRHNADPYLMERHHFATLENGDVVHDGVDNPAFQAFNEKGETLFKLQQRDGKMLAILPNKHAPEYTDDRIGSTMVERMAATKEYCLDYYSDSVLNKDNLKPESIEYSINYLGDIEKSGQVKDRWGKGFEISGDSYDRELIRDLSVAYQVNKTFPKVENFKEFRYNATAFDADHLGPNESMHPDVIGHPYYDAKNKEASLSAVHSALFDKYMSKSYLEENGAPDFVHHQSGVRIGIERVGRDEKVPLTPEQYQDVAFEIHQYLDEVKYNKEEYRENMMQAKKSAHIQNDGVVFTFGEDSKKTSKVELDTHFNEMIIQKQGVVVSARIPPQYVKPLEEYYLEHEATAEERSRFRP